VFAVNMFDDFDKYAKVPDEYQAPDAKAFQSAVSGRLRTHGLHGQPPPLGTPLPHAWLQTRAC
jgi:hypothetical protein